MRALAAAIAPALLAGLSLAATGASESPRHVASALAEQRALIIQRPSDAGVWNDLGNLLSLSGDLDAAEAAYTQALDLDPARGATRFNLALLREQRGDVAGAASDYRALLEVDPRHARAHYQLGAILERQGQRDEALTRYAEAFTLDPELLFAEINPHVIENRLVTEALLLARRGSRSKPATPRAYDEPGRITSLLEPPPPHPTPEEAEETSGEELPVEEPAESAPDSAQMRGTFGGSTTERSVDDAQPAEVDEVDRRSSGATTTVVTRDRVLDSSDLRRGVSNQIQEGAGDGMPAEPGARRRATAAVTSPGSGRRSLHQAPEIDPAFGFGQRSTGALEWRLGPATDQPVPAR